LAAVRLLLDVSTPQKAWQGIDPERMELLCVVTPHWAAAFAAHGFGVGLASNARLARDWRAADIEPAEGALPQVLEALARALPYTGRDLGALLAVELADESGSAECVLVTAALRGCARPPGAAARRATDTVV